LKQKTESIAGRNENRKRESPRDSSILPSSLKMMTRFYFIFEINTRLD
jgi:hypothetical protein